MNDGTASTSNDSEMSGCDSASTWRMYESDVRIEDRTSEMYLENQELRVFLGKFQDDLIHLFAWLCPRSPKVDQRDPLKVHGKKTLEMFGRGDFDEVCGCDGHGWRFAGGGGGGGGVERAEVVQAV